MLTEIFENLRDNGSFPTVEIAEEINMILGRTAAADDGTVFVVPYREKAGPNRRATGGHLQKVDVQFATAVLFREHGDPRGAERVLRFETARASLEGLLAGWAPQPDSEPCSLVGSEGSSLGNGVSLFVQTWQTSRFLNGGTP